MAVLILNTDNDIISQWNLALIRKFNRNLGRTTEKILTHIKGTLKREIENSRAWQSLQGGKLAADFGIPAEENSERLNTILNTWLDSVKVIKPKINLKARTFSIDIEFQGIRGDYQDVINLREAIVEDGDTKIEWLRYLLLEGDKIIIEGYKVQYGGFPQSRSGKAVMIVSPDKSWGVPIEQGTATNNFLTRLIQKHIIDSSLFSFFIIEAIEDAFKD